MCRPLFYRRDKAHFYFLKTKNPLMAIMLLLLPARRFSKTPSTLIKIKKGRTFRQITAGVYPPHFNESNLLSLLLYPQVPVPQLEQPFPNSRLEEIWNPRPL